MENLDRKRIKHVFSTSKELSEEKTYDLSYIVKPLLMDQIQQKKKPTNFTNFENVQFSLSPVVLCFSDQSSFHWESSNESVIQNYKQNFSSHWEKTQPFNSFENIRIYTNRFRLYNSNIHTINYGIISEHSFSMTFQLLTSALIMNPFLLGLMEQHQSEIHQKWEFNETEQKVDLKSENNWKKKKKTLGKFWK